MRHSRIAAALAAGIATTALVLGVVSPASAALPVPSINIGCAKLAAATDPAATFATPVTQRYSAAIDETHFGGIPFANTIQMAGGIECDYSNGIAIDPAFANGAVGAHVEYLPYGASGYARWAAAGGITTPELSLCETLSSHFCELVSSVGGDWMVVLVEGATSDAAAQSLATRMRDALQLGQKTPYVPPVYATPLPHGCEGLVTRAQWRTAVGSPLPVEPFDAPPGWSVFNSAELVNRGVFCDFDSTDGDQGAGSIQTLPGGRWAFAVLRSSLTTPGALTALTVTGMRSGDAAFTRCDAGHTHCILDALIATHWVQVDLWTAARGGTLITRDRNAALRVILRDIVGSIY